MLCTQKRSYVQRSPFDFVAAKWTSFSQGQTGGRGELYYFWYHIVWSTKYRYKVWTGALRMRVREILRQVCRENEVDILGGVLSSDHVHMFVLVPPKIAISDLVPG